MDSQKLRQIVKRAAGVSGKAALWTGAAVAGFWILGEAGKQAEEEEAQRPPIIAHFNGNEDTFTATFTTYGPWQISWLGDIDVEVWMHEYHESPFQYSGASGFNGSAFFPDGGTFYLVIRLSEAGQSWNVTVRSRSAS
jgi:hypothetical protein